MNPLVVDFRHHFWGPAEADYPLMTDELAAVRRQTDLEPYVQRCLDLFGEDRLLFGSDWPVCLLAASYGVVVDTLRRLLIGLPEPAAAKVLGANAVSVYRLEGLT